MKITHFTMPKGLITLAAAVILIIDPNVILQLLGAQLEAAGVMMGRILGGAYLVSGIGIWSIKGPTDISTRDAWLYALGESIAAASVFLAVSIGALNLIGWCLALAYVLFVCGFVYVALQTRQLNM